MSLRTSEQSLAECKAMLQQQQEQLKSAGILHDREMQQQKMELQQCQAARSAAEGRMQLLISQEQVLQEKLLEGERHAAQSISQCQAQVDQANTAQILAEGQVQALALRNKQLDLQLQRQLEAVKSASEKSERTMVECQARIQQMQAEHDHAMQQLLQQQESSTLSSEERVLALTRQVSELEQQVLSKDRQSAESLSKIQEELRLSNSAQVAADGQVQSLNLRNKQLELQLQRQAESVSEQRAQVETLERRLLELNRGHSECQQLLMATSLDLEAANKRIAELQVAAERT
jgi:hypothetical protein